MMHDKYFCENQHTKSTSIDHFHDHFLQHWRIKPLRRCKVLNLLGPFPIFHTFLANGVWLRDIFIEFHIALHEEDKITGTGERKLLLSFIQSSGHEGICFSHHFIFE